MNATRPILALLTSLALSLAACGGGASSGIPSSNGGSTTSTASPSTSPSASSTSSSGYGSATAQTCPNGAPTSSGTLDCTALPLGDQKYKTSGPALGYVYECNTPNGSPVVVSAPWLNTTNETWDSTSKVSVTGTNAFSGQFSESSNGTTRTISGNAEPVAPVTAGSFPITPADSAAYQYDHNPNSIEAHEYSFTVPANPTAAASPSCTSGGAIGVAMDGAMIYNAFDAAGNDAVAREIQDSCHGHPDSSDTYHYHGWLQACVTDSGSSTQNSSLLGYAADGYGIYGPWYNGKILTSADLDECHGTTSQVMWDGKLTTIYHYVSTYDFPYTVACYHGTPVSIGVT
ncbi:MAG TPA: YHYH protein [Candidatus Acidoferrales bacterium]|nr:YHYH protein [Candidatus Acidoferrales bacterium]